jgi:flagellar hook assembly protein FlgD
MRSKLLILLAIILTVVGVSQAFGAATVTSLLSQVPKGAYVNGPGGATDDNYYWQAVHITFGGAHADNAAAITITPPTDMTVADTNGDTNFNDEIAIDYTTANATTFSVNAATANNSIVITQAGGAGGAAANDDVWIMFPVVTASSPTVTSAGYAIDFNDNTNDADIAAAGGPQITYREAGALQIVDFLANLSGDDDSTTANGYMGLQYPNPSAAFYEVLTDFVSDDGDAQVSNNVFTADDDDSNDIMFYTWVSTDSTLSHVSELEGGVSHAENYDTPGDYTQREGAAKTDAIYTGGLPEGDYYFYVTSSLTGDFPLFRSGKLTVLHYPKVNLMGWDRSLDGFDNTGGHADDANLTLDTGAYYNIDGTVPAAPNSQTNTDLYVSVDDLDDNARLYLYYSSDSALTISDVTTTGSSPDIIVSGLTGATVLVDTLYENQEDVNGFVSWNWDVNPATDGSYITANSYTLYAVASDGKNVTLQKAQGTDNGDDETISIKHSPNLTLDVLTEYDLATDPGNTADVTISADLSDVIMLSWSKSGIDGDKDIDDSALIEFYIDFDTGADGNADYGSTDAATIRTASTAAVSPTGTHLIASGIQEDLEAKNQSYYEWNLKADFESTGWYPNDQASGGNPEYHIYAIIDENKTGGTTRVVCLGDDSILTTGEDVTDIEFELEIPFSKFTDPPAEGVTINAEETYRLNFNAFDFEEDGQIGIFLVRSDRTVGGVIGPQTATITQLIAAATANAGAAICLTDDDGDHAAGFVGLSENTDTYYDLTLRVPGAALIYVDDMDGGGVGIVDNTYWVYIGGDPDANDFGDGTEIVYRAPGPITFVNTGVASPQRNLTVSPTHLTIAQGDTASYVVRGADNAGTVDRIDAFIAVEKDYWTLVDSSTPFTAATEYSGQLIANTVIDDTESNRWILRLTVFNAGTAFTMDNTGLGESVATFQLVSKGTTSALEEVTSIYYVNEPNNNWVSQFSNDGVDITVNTLPSTVDVVPRAIIEGIVELQGRISMTGAVMGLELRERDSYVATPDTMFYNANGGSQAVGVQYTLDNEGKFTLTKVPTGEYDLVAVYDRYLAKAVTVNVYPGVDTLFVSFGQLLGGDCVGYTDSSGAAMPDNQIIAEDINRVSTAFLATPDSSQWDDGTNNWKWADINEDNVVEAGDLSLVTANSGNAGAQPVFKPVAQPVMSNMDALIEFTNIPEELTAGQTYSIQVMARNTSNVRAYFVDMDYNAEALAFAGILKGDFITADSYSFPVIKNGTVGLANSVYGNSVFSGDGVLAEVRFTAKRNGVFSADMLGIRNVTLVNGDFLEENIVVENPAGLSDTTSPVAYDLNQNFPNPFNPTTTISFTIPENETLSLKIYDILGRNVRTLVEGGYAAGSYNIVWDATDMNGNAVSAGVYFYTIKAGSYVETKRMLFMK